MQIIDTHCHLYLPEFDADRDEVVKRSVSAGVQTILMPNIDSTSVASMLAAEESFPGVCLPMMALHPTSVRENYRQELEEVEVRLLNINTMVLERPVSIFTGTRHSLMNS